MAKGTLGGSFTLLDCFEKGPHALVLRTSEPGLVPVGLTLGSSICKQGAFRPSKWNQDDITWLPPLTFYARGRLTHEAVALRKKLLSISRSLTPFVSWPELRLGKWIMQNLSPVVPTRILLLLTFETF